MSNYELSKRERDEIPLDNKKALSRSVWVLQTIDYLTLNRIFKLAIVKCQNIGYPKGMMASSSSKLSDICHLKVSTMSFVRLNCTL